MTRTARWGVTAFAVLVALVCWALSYKTQAGLAERHGFGGWEAWLFPGAADAAALVVMLLLVTGQIAVGWYTVEAWMLFAFCSAIMIGCNVLADVGDLLGAAMHSVVPVVAMVLWHLVVHGRPSWRRSTVSGGQQETPARAPAAPTDRPEPAPLSLSTWTRPGSWAVAEAVRKAENGRPANGHRPPRVAAAIDRLRDNGEELTSQTLARELGVGERQARRYLMKREPV